MQVFSDQIGLHYLRTRPEEDLQIQKESLYQYIQKCVFKLQNEECDTNRPKRVLRRIPVAAIDRSEWVMYRFGSEADGTALPDSDIDIGIHVNFKNTRRDKENLLYRLSAIISGDDEDEALLVKLILHARYPIIKVFHIRSHCTVNISIADRYCLLRHQFVKGHIDFYNELYSKVLGIDEAIKKFIVFIKHWSKVREINNAYHGYLNSFGFVLFVLKFLSWFTANKLYEYGKHWNLALLLQEFFVFYISKFDETSHSISVVELFYDYGEYVDYDYYSADEPNEIFDDKHNEMCVLELVDPVNANHNVAKTVGYNQFEQIKYEFVRAVQILEHQHDCLFAKLCKSTQESMAKVDITGHFMYADFKYSKQHDKDQRYKYDTHAHWILTKVENKPPSH